MDIINSMDGSNGQSLIDSVILFFWYHPADGNRKYANGRVQVKHRTLRIDTPKIFRPFGRPHHGELESSRPNIRFARQTQQ